MASFEPSITHFKFNSAFVRDVYLIICFVLQFSLLWGAHQAGDSDTGDIRSRIHGVIHTEQ